MSIKRYLLLNLAIAMPLWFLEASYSNSHCNFDGQPFCACIVYMCIIPSILFFIKTAKNYRNGKRLILSRAAIALMVPVIINYIGVFIANNTGGIGAEL